MGLAITTLLFHASLNQIGMSKHTKNAAPNVGFPPDESFFEVSRGGVSEWLFGITKVEPTSARRQVTVC
jgi:hypothetical protein